VGGLSTLLAYYPAASLAASSSLLGPYGGTGFVVTYGTGDTYIGPLAGKTDSGATAYINGSFKQAAAVSTAATALVLNSRYVASGTASITYTLPTTAAVGDTEEIDGAHAGAGWTVAQNAGQTIDLNGTVTTAGASHGLQSANSDSCVILVCTVANTTWTVRSNEGALATY
jgi:hypothetical protein